MERNYRLLIHPCFLAALSLHEAGIQDLEMHRWAPKSREAQVPGTKEDFE